ncbi:MULTISPECIES: universal stress protein [unclassified Streptomyces]|uniref:universal stress protein n=1 Tax=unclassified Streptomyces TaxID=2593676 RepID=UPI002E7A358F|nr:universal stress protein [Streptomyces sp. JV176]MEE1803501.1 universal stress protein [Streptomyces sp. JV176]
MDSSTRGSGTSGARALGPVVAGTDGSDHATRAVLWAADEAASRNRPLTVVHAIGVEQAQYLAFDDTHTILREARDTLDAAAARVAREHADIPVSTVLSRDEAAESLLEAAGEDGTVVVGSRGLGGFTALLVGSVGLRTAARANGPVVVVRHVTEDAGGVVTVAVRDDGDRDALMYAARTARLRHASLRVVSVWMFLQNVGSMATMVDDLSGLAEAESEATAHMVEPVRKEFPELTVTVETVRATSVAGALVEAAQDADLLVVGARRPAHRIGSPLGRVTHAVLHHAPCPVAVIPRG